MAEDLDLIRAGVPERDGCPVLRRLKCFMVQEGVSATLEHVFRDKLGNPVSLYARFADVAVSEQLSLEAPDAKGFSESAEPDDNVVLVKFREFLGLNGMDATAPYAMTGAVIDGHRGVVRCALPKAVYGQSGIYTASWAYVRDNRIKFINNALVSVERSLWGFDNPGGVHTEGPPTIQEVRLQMMDSDPAENFRLDDVEFDDEQIALALAKPIQFFNEANPPLSINYDTRNFPWKSAWLDAAVGYLYQFAAAMYRRNRLAVTAGGKTLDELGREREYLAMSQKHLQDWKEFVFGAKINLNMLEAVGVVGSTYGNTFGGRGA